MTNDSLNSEPPLSATELSQMIRATLEEGKAQDIVTVDLRGKTSIADFMIIASGTSDRHTGGLAHRVMDALKHRHCSYNKPEGIAEGHWVLVDAKDVIVHIFKPETRAVYNLEKMWSAPMFGRELATG